MKSTQVKPIESSNRITLTVGGEDCWIEVASIKSRQFAEAHSWFKRACSEKMLSGVMLIESQDVAGESVLVQSDEYKKLSSIMFAHLIVDWGFDDKLTLDAAANLLISRPDIAVKIDEESSLLGVAEDAAKKPQSRTRKRK